MSVPGHFQTSAGVAAMSAFLPLATIERTSLEVRFVPTTEVVELTAVINHWPRPTPKRLPPNPRLEVVSRCFVTRRLARLVASQTKEFRLC